MSGFAKNAGFYKQSGSKRLNYHTWMVIVIYIKCNSKLLGSNLVVKKA
jgi:hypothetical protein